MALFDNLNAKYFVETPHSKGGIIKILKERIDRAHKNKSWFSSESIEYSKMQIDDQRMIVKRNSSRHSILRGNGVIIVHFNQADSAITKINAEIKPLKVGFWVGIGFLVPFSALLIFVIPGKEIYGFVAIGWVAILGMSYLNIVFSGYLLKTYLKSIFTDIGIDDNLKKQ